MSRKVLTIILVFATSFILFSGCVVDGNVVRGQGDMESYDISVDNFTGLSISGNYELTIRQAPEFSVVLEIQENLFEFVEISERDGTLYVRSARSLRTTLGNTPRLSVYAPYLDNFNFMGALDADIDLHVENLDINVAGAGDLTLSGSAEVLNITSAGAANIEAFELTAANAVVVVAGAGNVDIYATDTLDVRIDGVGNVRYAGNPQLTQNIFGVGVVERRN